MSRKCSIRCQTADTPEENCECSGCDSDLHGSQNSLFDFEQSTDDCNSEEELCAVCGRDVDINECPAVTSGTLLAEFYDLDEEDEVEAGWIPMCDDCYESGDAV